MRVQGRRLPVESYEAHNSSFPGIGASPNKPGVRTYIDDVPRLNGNSSSIEFRGANALGFTIQ